MLLPTIPAPITTTLARVGRLLTRIPPPSLTPDHSIARKSTRARELLASADSSQNLLHVGAHHSNAEPRDDRPDQQAAQSATGADHRHVDLGAPCRRGLKPVAPLATGRP